MALKQQHRTAELAKNDTKMGWNSDSNKEKYKYSGKIPTAAWFPPQYVKQQG